jgi:hypothetical protein
MTDILIHGPNRGFSAFSISLADLPDAELFRTVPG